MNLSSNQQIKINLNAKCGFIGFNVLIPEIFRNNESLEKFLSDKPQICPASKLLI